MMLKSLFLSIEPLLSSLPPNAMNASSIFIMYTDIFFVACLLHVFVVGNHLQKVFFPNGSSASRINVIDHFYELLIRRVLAHFLQHLAQFVLLNKAGPVLVKGDEGLSAFLLFLDGENVDTNFFKFLEVNCHYIIK